MSAALSSIWLYIINLCIFVGNGRPQERWTKISRGNEIEHNQSVTPTLTSDYKDDNGVGFPVTRSENPDGKKQLSNGMYRQHRVYTDDEIALGRQTRWTELEVHGETRLIGWIYLFFRKY